MYFINFCSIEEIPGRLLSRIRACRARRGRLRLCALLPASGCVGACRNDFLGEGREYKVYAFDYTQIWVSEYTIYLVHAILEFAEDLRKCRKVQFAECVFIYALRVWSFLIRN